MNGVGPQHNGVQEKNPLLELLDLDLSAPVGGQTLLGGGLDIGGAPSSNSLDDILGLNLVPSVTAMQNSNSLNLLDSLGGPDLTSLGPSSMPLGLDGLLNGVDTLSLATPSSQVLPITAYEKHGLRVQFTFPGSGSPGASSILLYAHNLTPQPILNFVFQVNYLTVYLSVKLQAVIYHSGWTL